MKIKNQNFTFCWFKTEVLNQRQNCDIFCKHNIDNWYEFILDVFLFPLIQKNILKSKERTPKKS